MFWGIVARVTRQAAYEQELEQRAAQIEAHKAKAVAAYEACFSVKVFNGGGWLTRPRQRWP